VRSGTVEKLVEKIGSHPPDKGEIVCILVDRLVSSGEALVKVM
jgi:hypothetical protein